MAERQEESQWIEGEELEILNQLLSEDDLFEAEIQSSIENMPQEDKSFPCPLCNKVCVSSGGLKRHHSAKHKEAITDCTQPQVKEKVMKKIEDVLSADSFKKMVGNSLEKLSKDECYTETILKQFHDFKIDDVSPCYNLTSEAVLKFNGDPEKFYPSFYHVISSNNVFPNLSTECKLLLGFELANHVLAHLVKGEVANETVVFEEKTFTDKEKAIIGYVSGYVVGKLYRKFRFSKMKSEYNEQYLSLLQSCKDTRADVGNEPKYQSLVNIKNRGGLWKISATTYAIFSIAESYFQSATKKFITRIDVPGIIVSLMNYAPVITTFNMLRLRSELSVKKEIGLNLLEDMLSLYLRVRSHSYAKHRQQEHKANKDATRKKSLRTERKRANLSLESGH